ncbi:MAG: NirD/YgiW/YdeI family stress tolerance protein [Verrucomicrobiae bacterium]|nr:NirD/YgiW/YdeI family stress tolerance protein [Verrucomicrobiae bacterium]
MAVVVVGLLLGAQGVRAGTYDKDPDSNKWHITTVKWIKSTHNALKDDERYVVLIGKITKKIDGDTYLLNDDTGIIELDSDIELPVGKSIVVRGILDQAWLNAGASDYGNVEIEVKSWRYDKDVPK